MLKTLFKKPTMITASLILVVCATSLQSATITLPYPENIQPNNKTLDLSAIDPIGHYSFNDIFEKNKKTSIIVAMVLTKQQDKPLVANPYEAHSLLEYFFSNAREDCPQTTYYHNPKKCPKPKILPSITAQYVEKYQDIVSSLPIQNIVFFKITRSGASSNYKYTGELLGDLNTLLRDYDTLAEFEVTYATVMSTNKDLDAVINNKVMLYFSDNKSDVAEALKKKYKIYKAKRNAQHIKQQTEKQKKALSDLGDALATLARR